MKMKRGGRRIYILPTRLGAVFILGSATMIIIGAAFQNNLVNLVAYFMLALAIASAIQTHDNLKDVRLDKVDTDGGFAGGDFVVTMTLANPSPEARFNLEARLRRLKVRAMYESTLRLPSRGTIRLQATYPAEKRGRHITRGIRLSTLYPLGLFEAWSIENTETSYFVYPSLKGQRHLPSANEATDGGLASQPKSGDDFRGHRDFRDGDSHRRVDWKAHARGRPLLIKEFDDGSPGVLSLDWRFTEGLDLESRLSQLAVWVDEARARNIVFMLKIPGREIGPGQGLPHATICWQALATFDGSS